MKRAFFLSILAVAVLFLLLAGIKTLQIRSMIAEGENFEIPPETVASARVTAATWQNTLSAIGSLRSVQGITLSAEISGVVSAVHFENGDAVQKDTPLITLDSAHEEAQLEGIAAEAQLARLELDRSRQLRESNAISQSELDAVIARQRQAEARVEEMKALIAKKQLRAPFDGFAGIRSVNPGQFVNTGDKLVTVQSLAPIHVDFSVPQQELSRLKTGLTLEFRTNAYADEVFRGELTAINPQVESTTRNILLQGALPNKKQLLRPGLFGEVSLLFPEERAVLLIPQTAVIYATSGDSVFVVEASQEKPDSLIARQQFIRLGVTRGDFVEVTRGLEEGQEVVSAGAFKLRNGAGIVIDNRREPEASISPEPEDK